MSWDADLTTECCGSVLAEFNYTYNTTPMVCAAADAIGVTFEGFQKALNGMGGLDGRDLLRKLANELHDNPYPYEAMNPGNGWGTRLGVLGVMRAMADAVPTSPATRWTVS